MRQKLPDQSNSPRGGPLFLTAFLQSLGYIDLFVTLAGVLIALALRVRQQEPLDGAFVAILVGAAVVGFALGGLLIAAAAALRYVHGLALKRGGTARPTHYYTDPAVATDGYPLAEGPSVGLGSADIQRILTLLTDIRDFHMLSSDEREQAAERLCARAQQRAAEEVVDAINTRQLGKARTLLREAQAAHGATPTLERLQAKIDAAATRNESLDFSRSKRLVEEAISERRWALAEQYAHALHIDHPDSQRGRQLWENTRRARLYVHIQESAEQHHWSEALAAAEEFLQRFPDTQEAEALRRQLETLRTNAEILQRKQYEAKFKEYISGQHYADALRIARHVVEHFPASPQAHALRDQIPLLEKRVAG